MFFLSSHFSIHNTSGRIYVWYCVWFAFTAPRFIVTCKKSIFHVSQYEGANKYDENSICNNIRNWFQILIKVYHFIVSMDDDDIT